MFNLNFREFYFQYDKWIKLIIALFVISGVLGIVASFQYPDLMDRISQAFVEEFGENPPLDMNLAIQIFIQNVTASLIAWLGGLLVGLTPILVVLVNGFILGYVVTFIVYSSQTYWDGLLLVTAGLIPHAIFELPAFLLAAILGMKLGWDWMSDNARGARLVVLKHSFLNTSKYFLYVIGGLVIAAIVEVFVSGKLVSNL